MPCQLSASVRQGARSVSRRRQEPFARVAPVLGAALLLGAGGGFVFAAVLTTTQLLGLPLGRWWVALAQAHGHLQLYGWAGLFVLGVALHFLPRLRGAPLAFPRLVPWLLGAQILALVFRAACQPPAAVFTVVGTGVWYAGLLASGALEVGAMGGIVFIIVWTSCQGPALKDRPAFWNVLPLLATAFVALGLAALVNLANMALLASGSGLIPAAGDTLNITLGLLGFLVPMALAMSARALPMYAGLEAFPRRLLWPFAHLYTAGLAIAAFTPLAACLDNTSAWAGIWANRMNGVGNVLMGLMLCAFVCVFIHMMRTRRHVPGHIVALAPAPEPVARHYQQHKSHERYAYGPFVALVASAYLWALLGGFLLALDGLAQALDQAYPIPLDAARHSLALGFIALLISGVAPRMLPGFSGGHILSPRLVTATFWLGNSAAALRVGSLLVAPLLTVLGQAGVAIDTLLFGLSGPVGLVFAGCLALNLWPALCSTSKVASDHGSTP